MFRVLLIATLIALSSCSNQVAPKYTVDSFDDVVALQSRFVFQSDSTKTEYGYPSIEKVFASGLKGDCAYAAVLGKWSLSQIGIESTIYILYSDKHEWAHSITVSNDHSILVSNRQVIRIDDVERWQDYIFSSFGGSYTKMWRVL